MICVTRGEAEIDLCTIEQFAQKDTFVKLASREDLSYKARKVMRAFLVQSAWQEGGDFFRQQYGYAALYLDHAVLPCV